MDKDQDLAYTDRSGRRNYEYVSLGCDTMPVLKGRTPVQCYGDFMRAFRDHFATFMGNTIVVRLPLFLSLCFRVIYRCLSERRVCLYVLTSCVLPCRRSKLAWVRPASCATRPTRRPTGPGRSLASASSSATTRYICINPVFDRHAIVCVPCAGSFLLTHASAL
jgi:hypothetical protein